MFVPVRLAFHVTTHTGSGLQFSSQKLQSNAASSIAKVML